MIQTSYENIIRTIRNTISETLNLDKNKILNSVSVRGANLYKILNETNATSFDLSNIFIVFDLVENIDTNENIILFDNRPNYLTSIIKFNFKLHIYGLASHNFCQKLIMQFSSPEVILKLRTAGIQIQKISFPQTTTEFINKTMWPRVDVSFDLISRFIEKIADEKEISTEQPISLNIETIKKIKKEGKNV